MTWMDKTMVGMRSPEKGKKSDHDTTNDNHCVIVNLLVVGVLIKWSHSDGIICIGV